MTAKYYVKTYHVKNNYGNADIISQFVNPVFLLITILLIVFSALMLMLCGLLTCTLLKPRFNKVHKFAKKWCSSPGHYRKESHDAQSVGIANTLQLSILPQNFAAPRPEEEQP